MNVPASAQAMGLPRRYRPEALARRCAEAYGVQISLALGSTRGSKDVWAARQLLMLLLHEQYHWSYSAIGRRVGRDHTTVIWGVSRARARLAEPEHACAYQWVCGEAPHASRCATAAWIARRQKSGAARGESTAAR